MWEECWASRDKWPRKGSLVKMPTEVQAHQEVPTYAGSLSYEGRLVLNGHWGRGMRI
jgi:hypothetical protein